jgi:hypothetical protein
MEPRRDDERLSALLEGRVDGRQRDELLAHLSASDDDYAVFTDTAAVLRALAEEDARAAPPSMRPERRGWWSARRRAMAGMATAGLVILALLLTRPWHPSRTYEPLQLAVLAVPAGQAVPPSLTTRAPRDASRGNGPAGVTDRDARAVRAGWMLVDLSVAAQAGDAAQTRLLARRMSDLFTPGAGPGTPLEQIEARAGAPGDSLAPLLRQATDQLARLGREALEVGAWAEAALLAAHGRNAAFFEDGAGETMLRRAGRMARGDPAAEAAVARVRGALPAQGPPRWEPLRESLDALLDELTS